VEPLLVAKDLPGLLQLLKTRWTKEQLKELLSSHHTDAKKVALLALALVGQTCCITELARQLRDGDPIINELAEHALWSIWFRAGTPEANHQLARGAMAMERHDYDHAIKHFTRAAEMCPDFAEAYNQRAIAQYLLEHYDESIADCRLAVERMPVHFGAFAGMGHCFAHQRKMPEAIESYERALAINPRLECIRETVAHLRGCCKS
jgi:tetratricopeptide (TPR) repeat protein